MDGRCRPLFAIAHLRILEGNDICVFQLGSNAMAASE